jgi:hypothetical protein
LGEESAAEYGGERSLSYHVICTRTPPAPEYTNGWFTQHAKLWGRLLAFPGGEAAVPPSAQVLEIGSYEGRSAVWILQVRFLVRV